MNKINQIPFTIVIPVFNEFSNIEILCNELKDVLKNYSSYEIIFVNDCSTDNTLSILKKMEKQFGIKILNNSTNKGQSYSFFLGIKNSVFPNIITMDGDLQNNPKDIHRLLEVYNNNKFDLIGGLRLKRKDSFIKIISSKIANKFRSYILNDGCIDTGCSLKVFKKNHFLKLPYFDGIHRFLPALFRGFGYNTHFIPVDHRHRASGISKYGTFLRLFKGIRDLIKVKLIINRYKK